MIDRDEFSRLVRLAGLQLTAEEEERLASDLAVILDYVARLDELDLATSSRASGESERRTPLRPDRVAAGGTVLGEQAAPPAISSGLVRVPKVIP